MRTVAIIQARMGSTRLPGKVMKTLIDRTVLGHVIGRCQAIPSIDEVIVATSSLIEDEMIVKEAQKYGVAYYKGSLDHVLSRYYNAAKTAQADSIVRITSDCPLLDPDVSDRIIQRFLEGGHDYVSSGLSNTFPRGLDTEVFTFEALERAYREATVEYEFEHVTPYLYQHPELFRVEGYANEMNQSQYRLTLDTEEDWNLISEIYRLLYQGKIFGWSEIYELFGKRPDLPLINANVVQKKLGE
ncbi:glycosyltransferase family protein [Saccharibacillus sp. JS10]|uniref:glycosyltransferase family protein n=1 Tax=Saccharibacillus sp. JS10 TaxID=2950552 RepID=UPI00210A6C3F|nr:glycosyltransferase family protein [Saccharibacillus sp. JS10]MCQ4088800.1 glycosyltransferase family protein [Saccharibacillus sp. JS10]